MARLRSLVPAVALTAALATPAGAQQPVPDTTAPALSAVRLAPTTVSRRHGTTTLRFTLSEPAAVTGAVVRRRRGVRTPGGRCLPRRAGRHGPACIRRSAAGSFAAPAAARGANRARLVVRRLAVGDYELVLTATDPAGNRGASGSTRFRVDP